MVKDATRKKKTWKKRINVIIIVGDVCVRVCGVHDNKIANGLAVALDSICTRQRRRTTRQYEYFIHLLLCHVRVKHTHYWLFGIFTIFAHFQRTAIGGQRTNVLLLRIVQMPTCISLTQRLSVCICVPGHACVCVCCAFAFGRSMRRDILSLLSIVYHNC